MKAKLILDEMPKSCNDCILKALSDDTISSVYADTYCFITNTISINPCNKRNSNCPLVEDSSFK